MIFFPPDFHFAKAIFSLLFLFAIPLGYLWVQKITKKKEYDRVFHKVLYNPRQEFWNALLLALTFSSLVISLMEPEGFKQKREDLKRTTASLNQPLPLLFLLDTSLSMETPDGPFNKLRIQQAKEVIEALLPSLSAYPKALYTFQDHLQPLVPLTYDSTYLNLTLDAISPVISKEGTDFVAVLGELQKVLETKNVIKPRQIVLLSDGEDTTPVPDIKKMEEVVAALGDEGITWSVIGVGSKEGMAIPDLTYDKKPVISHLNEELLQAIAKAGKGRYIDPNPFAVNSLAQSLLAGFQENTYVGLYKESSQSFYTPLFPLFLLIGLLAFLTYPIHLPYRGHS